MVTTMTKDDVARDLMRYHFRVEPQLVTIYRIKSRDEDAEGEPIKLLEVNEATFPTGSIDAFAFAPTDDVPFPTVIAEVTLEEFAQIVRDPSQWPEGWDLGHADKFEREEVA